MIDEGLRARFTAEQKDKSLAQNMKEAIAEGFKTQAKDDPENTIKMIFEKKEDTELLDTNRKIGNALALIYKQIIRPLPSVFKISGDVKVSQVPPIEIKNFKDLEKYFKSLEEKMTMWAQAASTAPAPIVQVPKIEIPKFEIPQADNGKLIELIEELNKNISKMSKGGEVKFPKSFSIDNFPLQMTPQPVTNININGLQGFTKTSDNTVGSTVVSLPNYGQLFNRRSILIYNNSAATIYIGGSDVTVGTGLPVPANSYAPSIDAGYNMIIYGIAAGAGNDVRTLEVSKDKTANIQE